MLKEISIRNFAIIDDLKINFSAGLTILSGETGAGKSIILSAVNLLLGSRASADLVRTGAKTAELEGLFQISPSGSIAESLSRHGYDPGEGLLIRRIISRSDGNRVYINGRLATIGLLNNITENLASISGQHAHQGLLKEDQHLAILDQYGGLMALRRQTYDNYHQILPLIEKLDRLNTIRQRRAEHIELLTFQKKEIIAANPILGEDAELDSERLRLKNAETLYRRQLEDAQERRRDHGLHRGSPGRRTVGHGRCGHRSAVHLASRRDHAHDRVSDRGRRAELGVQRYRDACRRQHHLRRPRHGRARSPYPENSHGAALPCRYECRESVAGTSNPAGPNSA